MMILQSGDRVLLEQRPAPGIWGGLWCLPQYDDRETMHAAILHLGLEPCRERPLDPFRHVVFHFTLHIEPWLVQIETPAALAEPPPSQAWRSEEPTSELQSLMRISSAVF